MKTLLTGKPYVPAVETDLKKTFARIRRQLAEEQKAREAKVQQIKPVIRAKS